MSVLRALAIILFVFAYQRVPVAYADANDFSARSASASSLNYSLDVAFTMIDRLGRPEAGNQISAPQAATPLSKIEQPRTLGLGYFRAVLDWHASDNTSLKVTLRPDAVMYQNSEAEVSSEISKKREIDRRAGESYRSMPSIQFLDAYQITYEMGQQHNGLVISAGVWEELAPIRLSYNEILSFGLQVRFPSKFSALSLQWHSSDLLPPQAQPVPATGFKGELFVLEGDEDRAIMRGKKRGAFDEAPVAQDPYHGVAGYLGWIPKSFLELGLLVGSLESSTYDADEAVIAGAKRSDTLVELVSVLSLPVGGRSLKLSLDIRHEQERWMGDSVSEWSTRAQQSISFTTATDITRRLWLLLGAHLGKSERPIDVTLQDQLATYSGYQGEVGLRGELAPELSLTFMAAQEYRERQEKGLASTGGFTDDSGDHKITRRLGVQLDYLLFKNQ
jgi:hypothetical protein